MLNSLPISAETLLLAAAGLILLLLVLVLFLALRRRNDPALQSLAETLFRGQAELAGRLSQLSESTASQQSKIAGAIDEQRLSMLKMMDEKLLQVTKNVGEGLQKSTSQTAETLQALRERLAKIDVAQQKISSLSEQVVSLQEVLSNKQARGAFGEIQLNDLVTNTLPPSAYEFQVVLSNAKRADCVLRLPNPPGTIVIDSKFPLESYNALRIASSEREKLEAERFFRASVLKHIKDIAEKYIIPGETAESALMFLPSEAIYAELHANFRDVVEVSYRSQGLDCVADHADGNAQYCPCYSQGCAHARNGRRHPEGSRRSGRDIGRLDDRIENLSKHFEMASRDIGEIKVSSGKISRRIEKIEDLQLGEAEKPLSLEHAAVNEN